LGRDRGGGGFQGRRRGLSASPPTATPLLCPSLLLGIVGLHAGPPVAMKNEKGGFGPLFFFSFLCRLPN